MVLIGGGNSQRSASKRSTAGIRGATGSGRVEVSTAPRKADEAQKATGADPSRCAKGLPSQVLGIKVCSPSARGADSKTLPLGDGMLKKLAILKWRIEYEFWEMVYEWRRNRG